MPRGKPIRCVICQQTKAEHRPDGKAADCVEFVAASNEAEPAAGATPPSQDAATTAGDRQRTPKRRGRLNATEAKNAKQTLVFAYGAVGGGIEVDFNGTKFAFPGGLHILAPQWWTAEDVFQPSETQMLADATYNELEALYPKALTWLAKSATLTGHLAALYTVALVAAPRLERRGIIPAGSTGLLITAPLYMAAGRAPVSERRNGHGQEHATSPSPPAVEVSGGPPDEGGQA